MNLRKHITLILLGLVLFKTIEPLMFCISYYIEYKHISAKSSAIISFNSFINNAESEQGILSEESATINGIKSIKLKLSGNRLSNEAKKAFNESINKLLDHQQEKSKPQLTFIDLGVNYLCPDPEQLKIVELSNNLSLSWSYNSKLTNCFLSILTPPPQEVGA